MAGRKTATVRERIDLTEELDGATLDEAIERLRTLRDRHGPARIGIAAYEHLGEPHPRFAVEVERRETPAEALLRKEREARHEERLRRHYEQLRERFEPRPRAGRRGG
jgi:hypothetical protein